MGTAPTSVAIADLNGDGKFDLAVANGNSLDVSVLLGTGTGAFGPATNFAVGTVPRSVAIGDLNADGKLDLVVANGGSNDVSVLLGTGTGAFGPATPFSVGTGATSVVIGDLNRDGSPDLAVAQSNNVSVLLGTGIGTFGPATPFSVGTGATSVVIGDLNGDGNPDLAVANAESNNVSVLLGNGTGSFGVAANFPVGNRPWSVALGDLNGDGKPDLAVANSDSNSVSILLGTGTGAFGVAANFPVRTVPISVAIEDLNGDGKPDLAVANLTSNEVAILLGTGTGAFGVATNFAVDTNPQSVAIEDFDLDGNPDLVVANAGSNNVSILLNTTTAVLDQEPPNTSITFGPAGTTTATSASFNWTGSDNITSPQNLVYAYRLDPIEASFSAFGSATMKSYANLPNGSYTFHVKAKDEAGNEDQTPVTRSFTININSPDITVTPTSLNFGFVEVGKKSVDQVVTVKNDGSANLIIDIISLGGTNANQFEIQSDKCSKKTLTPSTSCTVTVRFKPTTSGAKTATLILPSNDPDESTLHVFLNGSGVMSGTEPPLVPDFFEPNDSPEEAHQVIWQSVVCPREIVLRGNFHNDADVSDWFLTRIEDECGDFFNGVYSLSAFVRFPGGSRYTVEITGNAQISSSRATWPDTVGVNDSRDLYIEVQRVFGAPTAQDYELTLRLEHRTVP